MGCKQVTSSSHDPCDHSDRETSTAVCSPCKACHAGLIGQQDRNNHTESTHPLFSIVVVSIAMVKSSAAVTLETRTKASRGDGRFIEGRGSIGIYGRAWLEVQWRLQAGPKFPMSSPAKFCTCTEPPQESPLLNQGLSSPSGPPSPNEVVVNDVMVMTMTSLVQTLSFRWRSPP
jgi:hypothetical protein